MRDKKNQLIWSMIAALGAAMVVWFGLFAPIRRSPAPQTTFSIASGETSKDIVIHLRDAGLARFVAPIRLYLIVSNNGHRLQAGDYALNGAMSPYQMIQKFIRGDIIKEQMTVIEGWTIRDIAAALEKQRHIPNEEVFAITGLPARYSKNEKGRGYDFAREYPIAKDKPVQVSWEGYLYPDTYEIRRSDTAQTLIRKMIANLAQKLSGDLEKKAAKQGKTIFQILTMASLLEKEVPAYTDKQIVSGILWKRLKSGMPLQVDATVLYALQKSGSQISADDKKTDSPYNTYKYRGLPLGPVSNPGLESINAALDPKESLYWYYLSAPDGKTIFSKTLEEHNAAKAKYLGTRAFKSLASVQITE